MYILFPAFSYFYSMNIISVHQVFTKDYNKMASTWNCTDNDQSSTIIPFYIEKSWVLSRYSLAVSLKHETDISYLQQRPQVRQRQTQVIIVPTAIKTKMTMIKMNHHVNWHSFPLQLWTWLQSSPVMQKPVMASCTPPSNSVPTSFVSLNQRKKVIQNIGFTLFRKYSVIHNFLNTYHLYKLQNEVPRSW